MKIENVRGKSLFMVALFVGSLFILGMKLLNPTPIYIYVEGSETAVSQVPGFFAYTDVVILVVTSFALGVSGTYLLFSGSVEKPAGKLLLEERKERWKETLKMLRNDEQKIYKAIIDSDGIISQSELVEKTGISKSSVSRALDLLESKGFVERRRRGMGNIVLLK